MELSEYSTEELRAELQRRAKEARANAPRKQPEYFMVKGVLKEIIHREQAMARRSYRVMIYPSECEKYNIQSYDVVRDYKLYPGRFVKATEPQPGDEVTLRLRKTNYRDRFYPSHAHIYDCQPNKNRL